MGIVRQTGLPPRPRRPDESMSLLVDIATQALDPAYAEAAQHRGPAGDGAHRPRLGLAAAAVVAATLLIVVAGVQAHRRAPVTAQSRERLVQDVHQQTVAVAGLERRVALLRAQTSALRDQVLTSSAAGAALARLLKAEEIAAGTGPVTGPGLQVKLRDAARSSGNRVLDRDLQAVVNALWAAGAEAIAVNGQRLTAQTAIRQAGDAILVDFVPVTSPFSVDAVGDPVGMETTFATSRAAARMRTLSQLYGLGFSYDRRGALSLPAAVAPALRYAKPLAPSGSESPS